MISLSALLAGFLLDLLLGDPYWLPHPVRWIGWLITKLETILRRIFPKTERGELAAGFLLTVFLVLLVPGLVWGFLFLAGQVHILLRFILEAILCYQALAMKSLREESMKVYRFLRQNDLPGARKAVSMIVGRDTQELSEEGVAKAAIETVAENTSDGVIAPLFYLAVGGAPFGYLYKTINTMDSMIGYRNACYLFFGRTAAKLDDLVNFIPARLSALLLILSAWILGLDGKGAWRIYCRDRMKHDSPNSAQTEAACAGALQIQLAGDAYYFGKLHQKPFIGDAVKPVSPEGIPEANKLLYTASSLCFMLAVGIKVLLLCVL